MQYTFRKARLLGAKLQTRQAKLKARKRKLQTGEQAYPESPHKLLLHATEATTVKTTTVLLLLHLKSPSSKAYPIDSYPVPYLLRSDRD